MNLAGKNIKCIAFDLDYTVINSDGTMSDATRTVIEQAIAEGIEIVPVSGRAFATFPAFLFYPFTQPHGSSKSGIGLFSKYPVTSALRRSLPISTSFSKFLDLDRCYSISRVPVDNGKELVIFALHMSAYGNSDAIREGQIAMLSADMQKEYEVGNYVLCGGDFNHDLKASDGDEEEHESWAYPFPRKALPEHFSFCIDALSEEERNAMWNSARNADMAYVPDVTYTVTLDGFIVSDNIECLTYENVDTGYSYSDHDPVYMEFKLK